jgi:hypothetical protein
MKIIDEFCVVYRIDNPYARLVVNDKKEAEKCKELLHKKFVKYNIKYDNCTLHDYFKILKKGKL